MTNISDTATRIAASFGALALSLTLLVGTFASQHAATFTGVMA